MTGTEPTDDGFVRAVALVAVPEDQATALLGAASGAGWLGPLGTGTLLVTEDPADTAGVAAGASELDRSAPGLFVWTCIDGNGDRSGGIAVASRGSIVAAHEWSDVEPEPVVLADGEEEIDQASALIEALGATTEPYLVRALLRRKGSDPEELLGEVLALLGVDPAVHRALLLGPPDAFTYVEPPGGFAAWRSLMRSDALRPKWNPFRRR